MLAAEFVRHWPDSWIQTLFSFVFIKPTGMTCQQQSALILALSIGCGSHWQAFIIFQNLACSHI